MALKKRGNDSDNVGTWLTTYGDLMTNLLCFFVLLFSMATIDNQKYEDVANSLRSTFQGRGNGSELRSNMGKSILTINFVNPDDTGEKRVDNQKYIETAEDIILDDTENIQKERLQRAKDQMRSGLLDMGLTEMVEVIDEKEYLLVRLDAQVLFNALLKRGVIVRPTTAWGVKTGLRITIGTAEENARFLDALATALASAG